MMSRHTLIMRGITFLVLVPAVLLAPQLRGQTTVTGNQYSAVCYTTNQVEGSQGLGGAPAGAIPTPTTHSA